MDLFISSWYVANDIYQTIWWLVHGPCVEVLSCHGYDINRYSFYQNGHDDRRATQNSRATLADWSMHASSSKDENLVYTNMSYFNVIKDIWNLDNIKLKVPIFWCKWIKNNANIWVDKLGFTLVDLNKEYGYKGNYS